MGQYGLRVAYALQKYRVSVDLAGTCIRLYKFDIHVFACCQETPPEPTVLHDSEPKARE